MGWRVARSSEKVALIQNHVGLDGRSNVLASIVEILNERGLTPDLLTFSGQDDLERFRSLTNAPLEFRPRRLSKPPLLKGDLLQELAIPYLARSKLGDYDLVFASSTAIYGYPEDVPLLRWICFPLEKVPEYEERYRDPIYRAYGLLNRLLYTLAARFSTTRHGRWLGNSEFTRGVMSRTYSIPEDEIAIIYGAIPTDIKSDEGERERAVVSIGGFHSDKRQLEQVELARTLPDVKFYIIGGVRSRSYFDHCQKAASGLANVELLPNASIDQVQDVFRRAKVFLHSKRFEHFGLGTVEGIAHGCIPIVHDSGGQREVVPYSEMRFKDQETARAGILAALSGEFDSLLPALQQHIARFGPETFKATLTGILDEALASPSATHESKTG